MTSLAFIAILTVLATGRPWFDRAIAKWIAGRRSAVRVDAAEVLSIVASVRMVVRGAGAAPGADVTSLP
jgi:hypothetical protein